MCCGICGWSSHIAPAHVPAEHDRKRRHNFFISHSFTFTFTFTFTVHICMLFIMSFEMYAQLRQFTAALACPLRVAEKGLATDDCTCALTPKSRLLYRSSHFLKPRSSNTPSNMCTCAPCPCGFLIPAQILMTFELFCAGRRVCLGVCTRLHLVLAHSQ
jgi:hypothetical protein